MGFFPKIGEAPGEPVFDPGEGITGPVQEEGEISYDDIDPVFTFKSAPVNLKYNKLIPFIGVYLIYKFIL